jgi:hypothetical protein
VPRGPLLAWLVVSLAGATGLPAAQRSDPVRVEEVKAAYVVNFIRYTEWPESRFAGPGSPFEVVVLDSQPVAEALAAIAERLEPIAGRRLSVVSRRLPAAGTSRRARLVAELARDAHLVYVGDGVAGGVEDLIEALEAKGVLTVGDLPGFAEAGGMIGLRLDDNRVVFDANPVVIRRSRVRVSARVLQLATIVGAGPYP